MRNNRNCKKRQKKQIELASDRENWYAYKTTALLMLKNYEECRLLSKNALEYFSKFHYSNDAWFDRKIALSEKSLGETDEALQELLKVLKKKNDWYIQKEIADLYLEKDDLENAFKYSMEAINNSGDLEYKIGLIELIGDILKLKKEAELSYKDYMLEKLLRYNQGWKINYSLNEKIKQFSSEINKIENFENLKSDLINYWKKFKSERSHNLNNRNKNNQKVKGVIEKILNNNEKGANGFIKYDNSKSVYFLAKPYDPIKTKIKVGLKVEFTLLPPKDGKKELATNLKIIE